MGSMDVVAHLGKAAGLASSQQRFFVPSSGFDVVAVAGRVAAQTEKVAASWGGMAKAVLGNPFGRGLAGTALGGAAGATQALATGGDVGQTAALGAGVGGLAAGPGTSGRLWRGLGRAAQTPFVRQVTGPGGEAVRQFAPGRTAGLAAAGIGGAGLFGKAQEAALHNEGRKWYNPVSWAVNTSERDAYMNNTQALNRASQPIRDQMNTAMGKGDMATVEKLQGQLDKGDYGGPTGWGRLNPLNYRMGGLNAFATSPAYHQQQALGIQNKVQGEYDAQMRNVGAQPGDFARIDQIRNRLRGGENMLPEQSQALQRQLTHLEGRTRAEPGVETQQAKDIAGRMQGMGMRVRRQTPAGSGALSGHGGGRPSGPLTYDYNRGSRGPDWSIYAQQPAPAASRY